MGFFEFLMIVFAIFAVIVFPLALGAWLLVKLTCGGREDRETSAEESRMIQELYNGLGRMERRIETLETLLLERERREVRHDV